MTGGNGTGDGPRFIVDHNVGKLARWLRMMGFDSLLFTGHDDGEMVSQALAQDRIILTRDTGVAARRVARTGRVRVILIADERPEQQIRQVETTLKLTGTMRPFTRCIECNGVLADTSPEAVLQRVPPYVARTQTQYRECPSCRRVYWRGTHCEAMMKKLAAISAGNGAPR